MTEESISVGKNSDECATYEGFNEETNEQIRELARQITSASIISNTREGEREREREREREKENLDNTDSGNTENADNDEDLIDSPYSLLRTMTTMSQVPGVNPVDESIDPRLDPSSDDFSSKFWVKNLRKIMQNDPDYYKPTSLGIAYKDLVARGISSDADYQANILNYPYKLATDVFNNFRKNDHSRYFSILKSMDALIKPSTLTVVLGRPGAGCSTLLKTIAAQTYGFHIDKNSVISYDGLTPKDIRKNFRGEVVYSAEMDNHFPHLTVGQTLEFASELRTPENRFPGVSRLDYAKHMTKVYMATYGLSHTINTKVGNDFVRGVSGGERKRVSIAEVSLCGASIQCWDNATRGLDAATALEFVRALKTSAQVLDITPLIAIYQCSQDAYDLFDNVVLLYEGYQIYYGSAKKAKQFFEDMGYACPERQTTADFLTSITSSAERVPKKGWETKVPKTPEEFESYWKNSAEYKKLRTDIDEHIKDCESKDTKRRYKEAHVTKQSNHARANSSYRLSYTMQIRSIVKRNVWRIRGDPSVMLFSVIANTIMGLIISSLFYNLPANTATFYYRTAAMFFAVLFNAFSSLLEIMALFESREIVEKHKRFALYHPSADAFASILTELPAKLLTSLGFNLIYYFMVNFRRNPGRFFFYLLLNFMATLVMSHIFRSIGSCFKSLSESMPPASMFLIAMVIYTGFALPTPSMHGWSRWINYLDPVAYVFEALLTNEFDGRKFACSAFIPSYSDANLDNQVCSSVSAVAGFDYINGTDYIYESYRYTNTHKWRNFGIVVGFIIFFLFVYVTLVEFNKGSMQKGEIIVFQQSTLRKMKKEKNLPKKDIESSINSDEKRVGVVDKDDDYESFESNNNQEKNNGKEISGLSASDDIFHWKDVCYEVQIKSETRRILNHVDGWVKPGTLTALMGASGAGKTTLLDVLANRVTMGVVSGSMFVNGRLKDASFQRSTGYVQQQDLHLQTSTVREALRFSAYLRQSRDTSIQEKNDYVEKIIKILEMELYADAIVGVTGEGLNVEQRKRLTIGVELAAKPKLLLFLDEPTSGLDSQTAWSICQLMRKLANNGQAILCTIHQPSAILLKEFDRLLFLAKGGRTVYFGDLGENCSTLINYFEKHGAAKCPLQANPAEWMLEIIGAAPGSHANQDYYEVWMESDERQAIREELEEMEIELPKKPLDESKDAHREFASNYMMQYIEVTKRVLQQYYRTPTYIWSKIILTVSTALFNGFSFFQAGTSLQGLQNQMLSIFMFSVVLNTMIQQMLPNYIFQRSLYEVRERPSKTFSWWIFMSAQITAEIPWNVLCGTMGYFCWYYPVGLYNNAAIHGDTAERGALSWLLIVAFFVYSSTLGQLCIAGIEEEQNGANIASLCFTMSLNFCGVLKYPTGFWIFMYRCNPFTYWVASMLSAGVGNSNVVCSTKELVHFPPPSGMSCQNYMSDYINSNGGYLAESGDPDMCTFCSVSDTNVFLGALHIEYDNKWRDWGIFICYIGINIMGSYLLYYIARVPKKNNRVKDQSALKSVDEAPESNLPDNV